MNNGEAILQHNRPGVTYADGTFAWFDGSEGGKAETYPEARFLSLQRRCRGFIRRQMIGAQEADYEDACQTGLLEIWQVLHVPEREAHLNTDAWFLSRAWGYARAHLSSSSWRHDKRQGGSLTTYDEGDNEDEHQVCVQFLPDDTFERACAKEEEWMANLLSRIQDDFARTVTWMIAIGYRLIDIARETGVSQPSLRWLLFREVFPYIMDLRAESA
jgi:DNA-directed RNA polymerase specialized sigma24 family protein